MQPIELRNVVDKDRRRETAESEGDMLLAAKIGEPHRRSVELIGREIGRLRADTQSWMKIESRVVLDPACFRREFPIVVFSRTFRQRHSRPPLASALFVRTVRPQNARPSSTAQLNRKVMEVSSERISPPRRVIALRAMRCDEIGEQTPDAILGR